MNLLYDIVLKIVNTVHFTFTFLSRKSEDIQWENGVTMLTWKQMRIMLKKTQMQFIYISDDPKRET